MNPSARKVFGKEIGDVDADRPLLERLSPSRELDRVKAPLFVFQGVNDPRVPKSESDELVRALRERHRHVEYMVAADEGHSLERRQNKIEFLARVARFLDDHLRIYR